ncbi:hypothetical protein VNO78_29136 [Psophocarpus tetragonolobus]|uniref:Uncharacterized protein n=1 Tax=Psophocarpus tetragonolobus TaxID=3891 RepID=A0AAN9X0K5_PSOTE
MADSEEQERPFLDSAELEMKKKRLLVELESALAAAKDGGEKTVTAAAAQGGCSLGLGIEVIDETALVETVAAKQARASARKRGASKPKSKSKWSSGNGSIRKYSRKELESLRFVNIPQQRCFWNAIHAAFQSTVATEYDSLPSAPILHNQPILGNPLFQDFNFLVSQEDGDI